MALISPAAVIARMGPQQNSIGSVGRSTSPDTEGVDIAAGLCAGVKAEHWGAVRLVLGMDARDVPQLERLLYLAAIDLANAQRWPQPPKGSERIRRMVHLALYEAANPGGVWVHSDTVGKKRRQWSGALRAEFLGMESRAFRATWAKPYEEIYGQLSEWVSRAQSRISRQARAASDA